MSIKFAASTVPVKVDSIESTIAEIWRYPPGQTDTKGTNDACTVEKVIQWPLGANHEQETP